ncbi:porin [Rhizobium daejeonense]|uniref:Porin n=1 Tax=Rhizobium daejeonense TaxID=240521 RepID=A0A6M1S2A6_9HYPH|nr:porin [Rhizobium daejeonense]NGO63270.1 porin [Rhizobium daejeonense]
MNIKSLLLGSAAALAVVSGAQAADAIVAAEPEPVEYVRVCDAFGTGYFYIPGTETCLKISGYVRAQVDVRGENDFLDGAYRTNTRGYLTFEAKSDSELGPIGAIINLETDSRSDTHTFLDGAVITVGGLEVGYFYNYWDDGLNGETDMFDDGPLSPVVGGLVSYIGGNTLNDGIRYTYETDSFIVGAAVQNFDQETGWKTDGDDVGVEAKVGATFGPVNVTLNGGYDFGTEDGAIRGMLSADLGPGKLGFAAVWSSGASRYWDFSEWSVAASYEVAVTEKFKITPGVQYWDNVFYDADGDYYGPNAWRAGVTLDYKLAEGLTTKASVQYTDVEDVDSSWAGFVRLQRSF